MLDNLVEDVWQELKSIPREAVYIKGEVTLDPLEKICNTHNVCFSYDPVFSMYLVKEDKILSRKDPHILAHELIHWTGKRVSRNMNPYRFEEVVAEFGAAKLLSELGIFLNYERVIEYCVRYSKSLTKKKLHEAADLAEQATCFLLDKDHPSCFCTTRGVLER